MQRRPRVAPCCCRLSFARLDSVSQLYFALGADRVTSNWTLRSKRSGHQTVKMSLLYSSRSTRPSSALPVFSTNYAQPVTATAQSGRSRLVGVPGIITSLPRPTVGCLPDIKDLVRLNEPPSRFESPCKEKKILPEPLFTFSILWVWRMKMMTTSGMSSTIKLLRLLVTQIISKLEIRSRDMTLRRHRYLIHLIYLMSVL